ncbi:MAG: GH36 C-terminal domain-containing protein, partial [Erysipelotrichaceae bacterium]|nr:GH36 C-terminal domain-containing protein [Erysipelotrichaceae bacterium]
SYRKDPDFKIRVYVSLLHEKEVIQKQIEFMKEYRSLIQFGTFYRLQSPFEGNETSWMVVSQDQKVAIVCYYRVLQEINQRFRRLSLKGLNSNFIYEISDQDGLYYGDELEHVGLILTDSSAGENEDGKNEGDFISRLFVIRAQKQ